jgi:hypothetical protein
MKYGPMHAISDWPMPPLSKNESEMQNFARPAERGERPVPSQMWRGRPSPGADAAAASRVPAQMWAAAEVIDRWTGAQPASHTHTHAHTRTPHAQP